MKTHHTIDEILEHRKKKARKYAKSNIENKSINDITKKNEIYDGINNIKLKR